MLATNYFRGQSNGSSDDGPPGRRRFVGISEMEQKLTINASLTKQLTGNGSITARFLYEGYLNSICRPRSSSIPIICRT